MKWLCNHEQTVCTVKWYLMILIHWLRNQKKQQSLLPKKSILHSFEYIYIYRWNYVTNVLVSCHFKLKLFFPTYFFFISFFSFSFIFIILPCCSRNFCEHFSSPFGLFVFIHCFRTESTFTLFSQLHLVQTVVIKQNY